MTDAMPTVDLLLSRYQQRLSLQWASEPHGLQRPLGITEETAGKSLIGYLNIIHPNRIQIIGASELDYLNALDDNNRAELLGQLFHHEPAVIILADNMQSPVDLQQTANQTHTPLLCTSLSGPKLITYLRHYLGGELAKKKVIHGVFLEVNGLGVLLSGESGIGKSELALELITRNHRLIADDAPEFSRVGPDTIRGTCPDTLRDFLEVRGLGVLNIRAMYGDSAIKLSKDLRLIIHLQRMEKDEIQKVNRLQGTYSKRTILDTEIPEVTLPVAMGRNLAVLVEAAVLDSILLRKDYVASEALMERQQSKMKQTSSADKDKQTLSIKHGEKRTSRQSRIAVLFVF